MNDLCDFKNNIVFSTEHNVIDNLETMIEGMSGQASEFYISYTVALCNPCSIITVYSCVVLLIQCYKILKHRIWDLKI